MNCPQCGKVLPVTNILFSYSHDSGRKRIGTEPAHNKYKPFCTLRCGYRFGLARFKAMQS